VIEFKILDSESLEKRKPALPTVCAESLGASPPITLKSLMQIADSRKMTSRIKNNVKRRQRRQIFFRLGYTTLGLENLPLASC
jgi:hypothetical protein